MEFVKGRGCGKSIPEFTLTCIKTETPLYFSGINVHTFEDYFYKGYDADGIHIITADDPREVIAYFCYVSVDDKAWGNALRSEYGNPEHVTLQNPSRLMVRNLRSAYTTLANNSELDAFLS